MCYKGKGELLKVCYLIKFLIWENFFGSSIDKEGKREVRKISQGVIVMFLLRNVLNQGRVVGEQNDIRENQDL